jgi:protein-tyrosine phosphatase
MSEDAAMIRMLVVCMGNICRSPMAHGVLRERLKHHGLLDRVFVDSAGTHGYHVGEPPDERAQAAALRRGVDIADLSARPVTMRDFDEFDVVLAMDVQNLQFLREMSERPHHDKIHLFMEFAVGMAESSVPDPYYGGPIGFERVLDLVEEGADGIIARLESVLLKK